ncbi:type II toxin-antitoxin system RelE/ParE family toxin [Komarekiella sp. 'clone 1']|uniref:Type II toxin-antitoxin system RelE/ParE family toxin n=1 Tax=Komarekiella delphini-convector SJRDD-AB1 TaxID=2593771 RepID=A0AA40VU32_9NOST|nr:type II toxin-antitoxin system RelE/ParE family toxin [Komarekiella delphini-convector]MBD6619770.1 type II toxin-antitoxin system RelE/ParE family toxin [Komarekiella delphini-convector SJRDD-AB1]
MNHYRLSQQAEQDLEDIWTYLAQQNQLAADKQIAQILNRFPMLAQFPDMGKKRDDLMKELKNN